MVAINQKTLGCHLPIRNEWRSLSCRVTGRSMESSAEGYILVEKSFWIDIVFE
jgi:hypothetical protein